jgi:hypothetical protein
LLRPTAGVGNGPGQLLNRWTGASAVDLSQRIENAPFTYPWLDIYRPFPGPNSNTFVQWVLTDTHKLGWRGSGRAYARHCTIKNGG